MLKNYIFILSTLLCLFTACRQERSESNNQVVREEMKNRKIRRVTEISIIENSQKYGKEAIRQFNGQLFEKLDPAQPFACNADNYIKPGSKKPYLVREYRIVCKDTATLLPKEREIWQAYQYNATHDISIDDNVQRIDDSYMLYTSPVTVQGKLMGMWSLLLDRKELIRNL